MEKLLTLVIPTYNMEKYLQRCLDSLLIKDMTIFDKLEVLIVNDGSKDNSSQIAHGYENKYPNVFRVIDKENGNYGSCINRGIDEAAGKYFKILDSDDWFDTNALSQLINIIGSSQDNVDVFYTEFTYHNFYNNTHEKHTFSTINYNQIYRLKDIPFADSRDEFLLKMYSVTIRTQILRDIELRLDTGISYTDNEYMYFPYSYIDKVIFIQENVYQYFIGREGQTISAPKNQKHLDNVLIITRRELNDYIARGRYVENVNIKNVLSNMVVGRCQAYYEQALSMKKNINLVTTMKELYNIIAEDKDLLKRVRKKSISFRIWEFTGLFKTSSGLAFLYGVLRYLKFFVARKK